MLERPEIIPGFARDCIGHSHQPFVAYPSEKILAVTATSRLVSVAEMDPADVARADVDRQSRSVVRRSWEIKLPHLPPNLRRRPRTRRRRQAQFMQGFQ